MKKKWMAVILAVFLALPPGTEAKAFDGASILGRILSSGVSHSTTVKTKPAVVKRSSGKKNRYKNAMGALENLQWVGVAKSSGGSIYFDQDTMKDTTRNGERRVTATVKMNLPKPAPERWKKAAMARWTGMRQPIPFSWSISAKRTASSPAL